MSKVIVVLTLEAQALMSKGRDPDPDHVFQRSFATEAEADAYVEGLEALYDLCEHEVVSRGETSASILIDGDETDVSFSTEDELSAFLSGLEDADGWKEPLAVREQDEDFDRLSEVLSSAIEARTY